MVERVQLLRTHVMLVVGTARLVLGRSDREMPLNLKINRLLAATDTISFFGLESMGPQDEFAKTQKRVSVKELSGLTQMAADFLGVDLKGGGEIDLMFRRPRPGLIETSIATNDRRLNFRFNRQTAEWGFSGDRLNGEEWEPTEVILPNTGIDDLLVLVDCEERIALSLVDGAGPA